MSDKLLKDEIASASSAVAAHSEKRRAAREAAKKGVFDTMRCRFFAPHMNALRVVRVCHHHIDG